MIHGFQVENWKAKLVGFPMEDSYRIDKHSGIIAVADGVTMDCKNGHAVRGNIGGALDIMLHYPRPSPAKQAADLFTQESVNYLKSYLNTLEEHGKEVSHEPLGRMLNAIFLDINSLIKYENERREVDFKHIDYAFNYPAGCTAALAYIKNGDVHWGYTTDCGVAIVSSNGDLIARTKDEGLDGEGKMRDEGDEIELVGGWKSKEGRRLIRRDYRNNPGESKACGILNGMPQAMNYVRTGVYSKGSNDYTLVFSDGISEIIFGKDGDIEREVADFLRKEDLRGLESLCKKRVKTEGTLVIKR